MAAEEELPLLRPVPREQAILESFFAQLGVFSFDRAKDYVEKEKENSSRSSGAVWAALLAALAHLAAAEKAYHNMTFLGQKTGTRLTQAAFSRNQRVHTASCRFVRHSGVCLMRTVTK